MESLFERITRSDRIEDPAQLNPKERRRGVLFVFKVAVEEEVCGRAAGREDGQRRQVYQGKVSVHKE